MAAIRSKDTGPELILRRALRAQGLLGYRCNLRTLPGKPDIAFTRWRLAIFVDGAFWHGHPDHFRPGTLSDYWNDKIEKTKKRDRTQAAELESAGYTVLRFWDFEVKQSLDECIEAVLAVLAQQGFQGTFSRA
jgi:DNA mismatch endonuclease, patch repair protein